VHALYSLESGQAGAARLLETGVTALVCASDLLALGAVRAVRRVGRAVPRDVSVTGFDDSTFMSLTEPPLTTVRQPIEAMGRAAVDVLAAVIEGAESSTDEMLFEPELVVRGSTGPRAPSGSAAA
jgi:DNA-binding LacI/PurR family transcriptional regulator